MCHACIYPSSAEYWHSGESYERLLSFRKEDQRRICSQRYDSGNQHHVFWGVWRASGLVAHLAEDRQQFQKVDFDEVWRTTHQVQDRYIRETWVFYWMNAGQHLFYRPDSIALQSSLSRQRKYIRWCNHSWIFLTKPLSTSVKILTSSWWMATTGGKKRALVHFSSQICNAVLKRDPQQCTKYNYQVLHKQMREKVGLLAPYPKCLKRVIKRSRRLLVPTKSYYQ